MDRRRYMMGGGGDGKLYLYNQGDMCTAVTGGWNASVTCVPAGYKISGSIVRTYLAYMYAQSNCWYLDKLLAPECPVACTVNAIDLTPYAKISIEYSMSNVQKMGDYQRFCFGVYSTRKVYMPASSEIGTDTNPTIAWGTVNTNSSEKRVLTVDISAVSRTGYIAAYFVCQMISQTAPPPDLKIYKIWLEP